MAQPVRPGSAPRRPHFSVQFDIEGDLDQLLEVARAAESQFETSFNAIDTNRAHMSIRLSHGSGITPESAASKLSSFVSQHLMD